MQNDEYGNPRYDRGAARDAGALIGLVIKLFYYLFAYLPIWAAAYFLTGKMQPLYGDSKPIRILVVLLLAYLLYCFIFFLKGILIVFKVNHKGVWVPLFILCIIVTCLLPTWASYTTIRQFLSPNKGEVVNNLDFWSALLALVVGFFIYNKYKFHVDSCPRMAFWAYMLGFNLMLPLVKNPIDTSPDRSAEFM